VFGLVGALNELLDKLPVRLLFVFTAVFGSVPTVFTVLVDGFGLTVVFLTPPGSVVCPPPLLLVVGNWLPPVVFLAAVAFVLLLLALIALLLPLLLLPPPLELLVTAPPLLIPTAPPLIVPLPGVTLKVLLDLISTSHVVLFKLASNAYTLLTEV
jgi:hypothetical protein